MIPFLLTTAAAAAKAFTYVKGGEVILKTTDALTGTKTHPVVSGFIDRAVTDTRETIRGVADPITSGRVFKSAYELTGLPHVVQPIMAGAEDLLGGARQIVAGAVGGISKTGHLFTGAGELPSNPAEAAYQDVEMQRRDAERALAEANARAIEAAERANSILSSAASTKDDKKKRELLNKARAAKRLIAVSQMAAQDAAGRIATAESVEEGLRYAMFALDSAQAAKAPPVDPLDVLGSSNVSDDEKERVSTIIDQINRDQDPDIRSIVDMGVGVDTTTQAVAGADEHPCGGNCGKTCCTGVPDWDTFGDDHGHDHSHEKPVVSGATKTSAKSAPAKVSPQIQSADWGKFGEAERLPVAGEWSNEWPAEKPKPKKKSEWAEWPGSEKVNVSGDDFDDDMGDDDDLDDVAPSCSTGRCNIPPPRTTRF